MATVSSSLPSAPTQRDSTVLKVVAEYSPSGPDGQRYLATGKKVGMRLWSLESGRADPPHKRDYEVAGYVIRGRGELRIGNDKKELKTGDSWLVPANTEHCYRIIEGPFECIEACAPVPYMHDRDKHIPRESERASQRQM